MPIHQATLRERWLAQQQYAETTRATYRETLTAFSRRFPCYAERVTEAMLDLALLPPTTFAARSRAS